MVLEQTQVGYHYIAAGTIVSLFYKSFFENDFIPRKNYNFPKTHQDFIHFKNDVNIEKEIFPHRQEQINLPEFKKSFSVKIRVRYGGKLQPPAEKINEYK